MPPGPQYRKGGAKAPLTKGSRDPITNVLPLSVELSRVGDDHNADLRTKGTADTTELPPRCILVRRPGVLLAVSLSQGRNERIAAHNVVSAVTRVIISALQPHKGYDPH